MLGSGGGKDSGLPGPGRPRRRPGGPRRPGHPRPGLGSLTCRERWLVSSGSWSGNSFRSMPPQSTTPSWVQPQSRGQAWAGPGGRRRAGAPSGNSLPAGGGGRAARPSARSPSASSARQPAGIAPGSREQGAGSGPGGGGRRRQGPARRSPPVPPAPRRPAFPGSSHALSRRLGGRGETEQRCPAPGRQPGAASPACPASGSPAAAGGRAACPAPPPAPEVVYCFFHIEKWQMIPEIYRGGYAMLFLCNSWSYGSS